MASLTVDRPPAMTSASSLTAVGRDELVQPPTPASGRTFDVIRKPFEDIPQLFSRESAFKVCKAAAAPFPGLGDAVDLVEVIVNSVDRVRQNREASKDLSDKTVDLVNLLLRYKERIEDARVKDVMDSINQLLAKIRDDIQKWGGWGFAKSYFRRHEIAQAILEYQKGITNLRESLHETLLLSTKAELEHTTINLEMIKSEQKMQMVALRENHAEMKQKFEENNRDHERRYAQTVSALELVDIYKESVPANQRNPIYLEALANINRTLFSLRAHEDPDVRLSTPNQMPMAQISKYGRHTCGYTYEIYDGCWADKPICLKKYRYINDGIDDEEKVAWYNRLDREVTLRRKVDHKNVVKLLGWVDTDEGVYLVTEWYKNQDIERYLKDNQYLDHKERLSMALDVARGLQYVHKLGMTQGSLQASDVLVDDAGMAMIGDLAVLKDDICNESSRPQNTESAQYCAVEDTDVARTTQRGDVYSWAMVTLFLCSGKKPYPTNYPHSYFKILGFLRSKTRPSRPDHECSAFSEYLQLWSLLEECWEYEVPKTMDEVVTALEGFLQGA